MEREVESRRRLQPLCIKNIDNVEKLLILVKKAGRVCEATCDAWHLGDRGQEVGVEG